VGAFACPSRHRRSRCWASSCSDTSIPARLAKTASVVRGAGVRSWCSAVPAGCPLAVDLLLGLMEDCVHLSLEQRGWFGKIGAAKHGAVEPQQAGVERGVSGGCDGGSTQLGAAILGTLSSGERQSEKQYENEERGSGHWAGQLPLVHGLITGKRAAPICGRTRARRSSKDRRSG